MLDSIGCELSIGDYVCYPTKYGDCLYLKLGKISGFKEESNKVTIFPSVKLDNPEHLSPLQKNQAK